jgi:hypothetical protein
MRPSPTNYLDSEIYVSVLLAARLLDGLEQRGRRLGELVDVVGVAGLVNFAKTAFSEVRVPARRLSWWPKMFGGSDEFQGMIGCSCFGPSTQPKPTATRSTSSLGWR